MPAEPRLRNTAVDSTVKGFSLFSVIIDYITETTNLTLQRRFVLITTLVESPLISDLY
jgi:hypothetical protein